MSLCIETKNMMNVGVFDWQSKCMVFIKLLEVVKNKRKGEFILRLVSCDKSGDTN